MAATSKIPSGIRVPRSQGWPIGDFFLSYRADLNRVSTIGDGEQIRRMPPG
jgi:hypothetical protein